MSDDEYPADVPIYENGEHTLKEKRARWVVKIMIAVAATLALAGMLVDRITTANQLEFLQDTADQLDEVTACRSRIAVELDVAVAEYNLADGQIDLLITEAIIAIIARDSERLQAAGQKIDASNTEAREKADALAVASQRRNDTDTLCPNKELEQ